MNFPLFLNENKKKIVMAEKNTEGRRMSRNILSDKATEEQDYESSNNKTGGRKSGGKPRIELYRPRMGMIPIRSGRSDEQQSWRNSKSPSPCPTDSFNKNRQVDQSHGKSKNFNNKKFESKNSSESLSRSNPKLNKIYNDINAEMKNLSVATENGSVPMIDLTLSPTSPADEKKKSRKPEQPVYVAKFGMQQSEKDGGGNGRGANGGGNRKEKGGDNPPAATKNDDELWEENPKNTSSEIRRKGKGRSKGKGRPREGGRESEDKDFGQSFKEDGGQRRQFDNRQIQRQMSSDSARYQKEVKNDRRNYNPKKHDDKRKLEGSKSSISRDMLGKSSEGLNYSPSNSPEPLRNQSHLNVKTDKRDFRQNSEPRMLSHGSTNTRHNANNSNNVNHNPNSNRLRDTRSMEHSTWSSDRMQSKPLPGRRGSGSISITKQAAFDSLPPRLKKKYMEEKGMSINLPSNTFIGTTSEEQWDGGSLSFLNNSAPNYQMQQYSMPPPQPPPNPYPSYQQYPPQQWSQTMPTPKGLGRGRLRSDDMDKEVDMMKQQNLTSQCDSGQNSRSSTPFRNISQSHENISNDRNLMPPPSSLPPRSFSSHDQVAPYEDRYFDYEYMDNRKYQRDYDGRKNSYDSRNNPWKDSRASGKRSQVPKTPTSSDKPPRSRKLSNGSTTSTTDPEAREVKKNIQQSEGSQMTSPESRSVGNLKSNSPKILDWSEEVEESERQEKEAISRSSSVASLSNLHSSREKKRQRRRGGKKDRSLSRETGRFYRNSSQDRYRNQRRQSDENVYRPASRDRNKGCYGFHRNGSRESSRDRDPKIELLDWRRSGDQEKDWRRDREKIRDPEKEETTTRWRDDKRMESMSHHDMSNQSGQNYNQRGFIQLQQPHMLQQQQQSPQPPPPQRQLFDPSNPSKPIIVNSLNSRVSNTMTNYPDQSIPTPAYQPQPHYPHYLPRNGSLGDGVSNTSHKDPSPNRPAWYDHTNESFRQHRKPILLLDIERADTELQCILRCCKGTAILQQWGRIDHVRQFLQQSLHTLLMTELKFCQEENVEQHMWKITYYNLIETLRKSMAEDSENKENYKEALLNIVEEGMKYFDKLIQSMEENYNFKVENFLTACTTPPKGLVIVSLQKIMLFLGDLARYKEVANESNNYGKSRQWYSKAQQLNPKNGRPYYQLAILAFFARRKLDAVYYYMRSLMASNPLQSAKESLVSLFDENRKKYEQIEKRKREEKESKYKERVKEKEGSSLRREIWVHPSGRRRVHRTTSTSTDSRRADSEDEELSMLSSVDVNKRFTTSYLHVHGKLFTKVGMETFQDAGIQMLREFRALLQHSPLPLGTTRFIQLLALNMFAIENTQLKDTNLEPGYRSAVQVNALIISLQMFNLILERTVVLLREQIDSQTNLKNRLVCEDVEALLPAIKVWCDWLLCHGSVWNPPPSCAEFRVGPPGDAWSRLATLVNLLDKLEHRKTLLMTLPKEGFELVTLPEDATLYGFTPLLLNEQDSIYTSSDVDMELAQCCLRIRKILFFGTVFLCGIEPPVLKLQKFDTFSEFVSVVDASGQSQSSPTEDQSDAELFVESFSEEECDELSGADEKSKADSSLSLNSLEISTSPSTAETRRLLIRKEELEKKHQRQERHRKRVQAILQRSGLSVVIEVKPRYLVPDTNCFIDYLTLLQKIATCSAPGMEPYYILTVPLIVLNELEGLARGGRDRDMSHMSLPEKVHAADVSESARTALSYLKSTSRTMPKIRCVTTRGKFINSFTPFTVDDDVDRDIKNDDRILATCLSLCRNSGKEQLKPGDTRHLVREVVLLTEDRNLRVKALARDVPVREVPDFAQWAGLG